VYGSRFVDSLPHCRPSSKCRLLPQIDPEAIKRCSLWSTLQAWWNE